MLTLQIEKREIGKSNLSKLREDGNISAVFYGKNVESTPITTSAIEFKKLWKQAGTSSLINLKGVDKDKEALIYDVDINPVSGQVRNVDFYIIEKGKLMEVEVPLEFVGVSSAVKTLGGILVKVLHELEIEVLPKDLPQHIEVDISSLVDLDSQILVKDLKLPSGVKILNDEEDVVVAISQAEEDLESTPVDISSVEVEKKGKKDAEEPES